MARANRLIEVFTEAEALGAGAERDAFVARACGDDSRLREQVASLLQVYERAGQFLEKTIVLPPELEQSMGRLKPERVGDLIGPYKLRERIGEGGFGVVWVAEQEKPVRRTVALKIIKLGMDTDDAVARFEQERQALALMDHPNIARVFDAGVTDHGRSYFVMELVRGIKITDYCDQANLPTVERLSLLVDVCHAVQHAHQKGIIHRDLKPSNILVTLHDGVPVPKVIDFGVAKATQGRLVEQTICTQFQQMIGTPLYMSPEQVEMNGLDVDTRADIYVLGVLLYELLTGRTPFDADALMKAGYDEMRRVIREQEPQKPSTALDTMAQERLTTVAHHRNSEPPKLIHSIRGDLDWIVMKCLEKDRTRRYETANGLAADIQRHLDNEPVMARPPSKAYQFRKWARRNKLVFAAGTAIAASLVVGFATSTWMYLRESAARERESAARERATTAEKLATERLAEVSAERDAKDIARKDAEAISTFIAEVFQSPDPERDGRTITVAETLDRAKQRLEIDLADQPAQRAMLQVTLGKTYHALGLFREAIPLRELGLEHFRATSGYEHPNTLLAMTHLASSYGAAGRRDEALKLHEEVLALRRRVLHPEHPDVLAAMNFVADFYHDSGRREEALKLREELLTLRRKVLGPEDHNTIWSMHNLAISYYDAGRRDEALKLREEVLALRRKESPNHPATLAAMHDLAISYADARPLDEQLKLLEELLPLRRKVLGPEHVHTQWTMAQLANAYQAAGHREEAIKLREESLALRRKALGPEHFATLILMQDLANVYETAGRRDEAIKLQEEMLAVRRKEPGAEHINTLRSMSSLANSYAGAGRSNEALQLREEVLALRGKVLGQENPETLWAMHSLALSYYGAGRHDEALKLREAVLPLRHKVLGPEDPDTIWAMHELANTYHTMGRQNEALKLREQVLELRHKVLSPNHPDTLSAMHELAISYHAAGRWDEALELREEVLELRRKVLAPNHPSTLAAMNNLVDSYVRAGRLAEATPLMAHASTRKPEDIVLATKVATLQLWFAMDADYEATCQRMLKWTTNSDNRQAAQQVAKFSCLRPLNDASMRQAALDLALRAADLGDGKKHSSPWHQMTLGMAEYRSGHYPAADEALAAATRWKFAPGVAQPSLVECIAFIYRAMSLFQQGRQAEAREVFDAIAVKMKPLPADERNPFADGLSNHDDIILWLAYKEARALLKVQE